MTGLETLRHRYPLPDTMPDVPLAYRDSTPPEPTGWCAGQNRHLFGEVCNENTRVVIDGGSYLGLSAWWLLRSAPSAAVICIDHWKGSAEHQGEAYRETRRTMYETFLRNLWEFRDRIIPMRSDSVDGMKEIAQLGITPDVIYVDWSHDEGSVYHDLTAALDLFPSATIIGDDWTWDSVRAGVALAVKDRNIRVISSRTCYRLERLGECV